jgi:hypothetical protein
VAHVKIEVGLPPLVYDWLLLNSAAFVVDTKDRLPLEKRVVDNKTYRVLKTTHANILLIWLWGPKSDHDSLARGPKGSAAVQSWFDAIEPVFRKIRRLDDVVSLAPWCAKLVVAPEEAGCPWRRRKT